MTRNMLTPFALHCLLLLCGLSHLTSAKDLSQILDESVNGNQYDSLDAYPGSLPPAEVEELETLKDNLEALADLGSSDALFDTVETPVDLSEGVVSKRPFCNGFTGCGRYGKRNSDLLSKLQEPVISKRPFCNGFFGCGNPRRHGKRIAFRNQNSVRNTRRNDLNSKTKEKRVFCNSGPFGCLNPGKRSSVFSMPWIQRLLAMSSQGRLPLTG